MVSETPLGRDLRDMNALLGIASLSIHLLYVLNVQLDSAESRVFMQRAGRGLAPSDKVWHVYRRRRFALFR